MAQASCILPRRSHFAISCRRSGRGIFDPKRSTRFCFRYWPTRLQRSHDRRTVSRGYSRSCRDPPAMVAHKEKGCRMIHIGSQSAGHQLGGLPVTARLKA